MEGEIVISTFDQTLAKTHRWLDDLDASLGWHDRERCYHALKAVLHALRDRLPIGEVADQKPAVAASQVESPLGRVHSARDTGVES